MKRNKEMGEESKSESRFDVGEVDDKVGGEINDFITDEEAEKISSIKEIEELEISASTDTIVDAEFVKKTHEIGSIHDVHSMVNGLVYMIKGLLGLNLRLCIPSSCVSENIELVHSLAHRGIGKTFQSLSTRYYFPHMAKLVKACQSSWEMSGVQIIHRKDRREAAIYPVLFDPLSHDFNRFYN